VPQNAKKTGNRRKTKRLCQEFWSHLDIREEVSVKEGPEMLEHAVAGQLLQWTSREVCICSHEQQVR
jgi:hypothetical protein